jgi:hypothetical protein
VVIVTVPAPGSSAAASGSQGDSHSAPASSVQAVQARAPYRATSGFCSTT